MNPQGDDYYEIEVMNPPPAPQPVSINVDEPDEEEDPDGPPPLVNQDDDDSNDKDEDDKSKEGQDEEEEEQLSGNGNGMGGGNVTGDGGDTMERRYNLQGNCGCNYSHLYNADTYAHICLFTFKHIMQNAQEAKLANPQDGQVFTQVGLKAAAKVWDSWGGSHEEGIVPAQSGMLLPHPQEGPHYRAA